MTRDAITVQDAAELKYCHKGLRFFARQHNLDWTKFLREGLPLEEAEKIDDAMIREAIGVAQRRIEREENGR